ncbi:MAG TPA: hypothetical protein VKU61_10925 [Candidatus Binatia bacterium]|nr:hypothetical protein [Candidatus Binatia bacterium]
MRPGEWLATALILAFLAVKIVETALAIDSWPLTTVPMFAERAGPETFPMRMALVGHRRGAPVTISAADVGLSDDELRRRVASGTWVEASQACGTLGAVYNQTHPAPLRLDVLEARFIRIPRPGVPTPTDDVVVPCPFQPPRRPS